MLSPRRWPTQLWVACIASGILLLHAIGLAVTLGLLRAEQSDPASGLTTPSQPWSLVELYTGQVLTGSGFALVILIFGLYASIRSIREADPDVAPWGRVFLVAIIVLVIALVGLGLPIFGLPGWSGL